MFKFFTSKIWFKWSILGSIFILVSTWYQVQLDVKINEWFGEFYDTLQKALTTPNSVSEAEFIGYLFTFAKIAGLWIIIAVFTGFFTSHWVFRWRTSMADYYHKHWLNARLTTLHACSDLWACGASVVSAIISPVFYIFLSFFFHLYLNFFYVV